MSPFLAMLPVAVAVITAFVIWFRFEQARAIELPDDPYNEDDGESWLAYCADQCHAPRKPCDGCLAGGFCEGMDQ